MTLTEKQISLMRLRSFLEKMRFKHDIDPLYFVVDNFLSSNRSPSQSIVPVGSNNLISITLHSASTGTTVSNVIRHVDISDFKDETWRLLNEYVAVLAYADYKVVYADDFDKLFKFDTKLSSYLNTLYSSTHECINYIKYLQDNIIGKDKNDLSGSIRLHLDLICDRDANMEFNIHVNNIFSFLFISSPCKDINNADKECYIYSVNDNDLLMFDQMVDNKRAFNLSIFGSIIPIALISNVCTSYDFKNVKEFCDSILKSRNN